MSRRRKKSKSNTGRLSSILEGAGIVGVLYTILVYIVYALLKYKVVAFLLFGLVVAYVAYYIYCAINGFNSEPLISADNIDIMDGHDFEHWCAKLLEANGFQNVYVTPGSNDQGVDIIASINGERYAIQCKRYSKRLGNTPVQEVASGRNVYCCTRAAVMTNNYFTEGAIAAASANDVELWDRTVIFAFLDSQSK